MTAYSISIRPFGSHAILVEWPQRVDEEILDDIIRFTTFLKNHCLDPSKWEVVSSYNSVTLIQRGTDIDHKAFQKKLETWYTQRNDTGTVERHLWRLPVCYDLEFGVDLPEVAEKLSKSIPEIIEMHTSSVYTVYGIGFLPGFMYLGGLSPELEIPRRAAPRLKVMKGSVGLAGKQTGIYPQDSPGGWNIIGNCAVDMFDPNKNTPCFVSVGDKVQFYAIEKAEYDLRKIEAEVGIYKLEKERLNA